jgi:hypothetical protein
MQPNMDFNEASMSVAEVDVPVSAGIILSESFRTFGANFLPFVAILLICCSPAFVLQILGATQGNLQLTAIGAGLVSLLAIPAQGALVYGTVQFIAGRPASLGENIGRGFSSLLSVIAVAIVVGIVVMFGFILLIIPGFILLMMYYVAIPVAVVEGGGVGAAMSRSSELTKGFRWTIFGAVFVVGILQQVITYAVQAVGTSVVGLGAGALGLIAMQSIVGVVMGALSATMSAVVYVRLRHSRDRIDANELSSVFE